MDYEQMEIDITLESDRDLKENMQATAKFALGQIDNNKTGISNLQDDTAKTKGKPSLQSQLDALEKRVKALGG